MTVELLELLSLISFILAGVLLLLGIALFFLLDVPKLYGDISGRTAKKAIEAIRQQNEATGNKAFKPSKVNEDRGRLTDRISASGKISRGATSSSIGVGTQKFATGQLAPQANETTVLNTGGNETTVLQTGGNETTVLNAGGNETTVLQAGGNETTVLMQPANETTVLTQEVAQNIPGATGALSYVETASNEVTIENPYFVLEVEMNFTGSTEIIE